jgi:hypothetical protein
MCTRQSVTSWPEYSRGIRGREPAVGLEWTSHRLREAETPGPADAAPLHVVSGRPEEQYDHASDRNVAGPMRETVVPEGSSDPPTELSRFP